MQVLCILILQLPLAVFITINGIHMYTPKLLFTLNSSKCNSKGEAPILVRITLNNKRATTSTGYKTLPESWDKATQRIKGNTELASTFNAYANTIGLRVLQIERELLLTGEPAISSTIINHLKGQPAESMPVLEAFKFPNKRMLTLVGKDMLTC